MNLKLPLTFLPALFLLTAKGESPARVTNNTLWGRIDTTDGRYFVINNAYKSPPALLMSCYLDKANPNDFGGYFDFKGGTGGIGVAQINYGHWPWGKATQNSGLPVTIDRSPVITSHWTFTRNPEQTTNYNLYWEIWLHDSKETDPGSITGDLMIHPDYGSPNGSFGHLEGIFTLDGAQWEVRTQTFAGGRKNGAKIFHYLRSPKVMSATVHIDQFAKHAAGLANRGPLQGSHWIGSVTAALEAFEGRGNWATGAFSVVIRDEATTASHSGGKSP